MPDGPAHGRGPIDYAPAPASARSLVLRRLRPGTTGFFLLIALPIAMLIGAVAWGGWKQMLYRDRQAFEACARRVGLNYIEFVHPPSRAALRHLARLPGAPWTIHLYWPAAEGPAPVEIAAADVTFLWIGPGVDADAFLAEFARPGGGHKGLATLTLSDTRGNDAKLGELARPDGGLKDLANLTLDGTDVTDAGLAALCRPDSGLRNLTYLNLRNTHVSEAGIATLRQARPSLRIEH